MPPLFFLDHRHRLGRAVGVARCRKAAVIAALLLATLQTAVAGSATWNASPANGDWNSASNWTPSSVPNNSADVATFGSSNVATLSLSANTVVDSAVFNAGASSYSITSGAGITLTFSGAGIVNNSGNTQKIMTPGGGAGGVPKGFVEFINSSTAGKGNLVNNGGSAVNTFGGQSNFRNNSSAGNAVVTNNGGTVAGSGDVFGAKGGITVFFDTSAAGNGIFTCAASQVSGQNPAGGGAVEFLDSSSAGNGVFTLGGGPATGTAGGEVVFANSSTAANGVFTASSGTGGGGGGYIGFFDNSSAGQSVITVTGGELDFSGTSTAANATLVLNGGSTYGSTGLTFFGASTGGNARVELLGASLLGLDFYGSGPSISVGSLEGDGIVSLGYINLTVGGNDLSTVFSGQIADNGYQTHPALTKVGSGTLRLTGTYNEITAGTIINAGRLFANNSSGPGTGPGPVTVNNAGSVFGGTGVNSGQTVTINSGAALMGGDGTAASGSFKMANSLTMNPGSIIELVLGPLGAHSTLTRTGGTWNFAPNQRFTFIDVGIQPGIYNDIITGLTGDPGGVASWTVTNTGLSYAFVYDGLGNIDLNVTSPSGSPLGLTSAVSRKTHGAAGIFGIPLPITGEPGVECRYTGGAYTLVFTFNNNIVSGNASVTAGIAGLTGGTTFSGNAITVNLNGVADVQKITLTLSNVTDNYGQIMADTPVSVNILVGDTTGDKSVNSADITQTKGQSGTFVTGANFRMDLNVDGNMNSADIIQAKLNSGHGLP